MTFESLSLRMESHLKVPQMTNSLLSSLRLSVPTQQGAYVSQMNSRGEVGAADLFRLVPRGGGGRRLSEAVPSDSPMSLRRPWMKM